MNSIRLNEGITLPKFSRRKQSAVHNQSSAMDPAMQSFMEEVRKIEEKIGVLKSTLRDLDSLHNQSQTVFRAPDIKALKNKCQVKTNEALKLASTIKKDITSLKKSNSENRRRPECGPGSATDTQRTNITNSLNEKLKKAAAEYADLKDRMDRDQRATLKRRFRVVTGADVPDEDVNKIVTDGNSEEILKALVAKQGGEVSLATLNDTISEVEERRQGVAEITKQLLDLHNLFLEISVLIETQEEVIVDVDKKVTQAQQDTAQGSKSLADAWKIRLSTRKWQGIGVLIILIVILIIALTVWFTTSGNNSNNNNSSNNQNTVPTTSPPAAP